MMMRLLFIDEEATLALFLDAVASNFQTRYIPYVE